MMDASILLPPTGTPLTGIDFVKRLPCGDVEKTRRVSGRWTQPLLGCCLPGAPPERGEEGSRPHPDLPSNTPSEEPELLPRTPPPDLTSPGALLFVKAEIEIPSYLATDARCRCWWQAGCLRWHGAGPDPRALKEEAGPGFCEGAWWVRSRHSAGEAAVKSAP